MTTRKGDPRHPWQVSVRTGDDLQVHSVPLVLAGIEGAVRGGDLEPGCELGERLAHPVEHGKTARKPLVVVMKRVLAD